MDNVNALRERLAQEIIQLPEDKLAEVLNFAGSLLTKEHKVWAPGSPGDLDPAQDPILKFIGGVSHGSLAKDIDRELYGE